MNFVNLHNTFGTLLYICCNYGYYEITTLKKGYTFEALLLCTNSVRVKTKTYIPLRFQAGTHKTGKYILLQIQNIYTLADYGKTKTLKVK